jgi:hypothetical protein
MPEHEAFERGRQAGDVQRQLEQHEERLALINGHLSDVAKELRANALAMQSMADGFKASAATVLATAEALAKAQAARRETDAEARVKEEKSWSPFAKTIAVLGVIGLIIGAIFTLRQMLHLQ